MICQSKMIMWLSTAEKFSCILKYIYYCWSLVINHWSCVLSWSAFWYQNKLKTLLLLYCYYTSLENITSYILEDYFKPGPERRKVNINLKHRCRLFLIKVKLFLAYMSLPSAAMKLNQKDLKIKKGHHDLFWDTDSCPGMKRFRKYLVSRSFSASGIMA